MDNPRSVCRVTKALAFFGREALVGPIARIVLLNYTFFEGMVDNTVAPVSDAFVEPGFRGKAALSPTGLETKYEKNRTVCRASHAGRAWHGR